MAVDHKLLKGFANFQGLDLRSSDLQRSSEFATEALNVDFRKTGAMTKRKGHQAKQGTFGGFGTGVFADLNTTTGQITEKLVTVDSNLYIQKNETLTITYTGPDLARADLYLLDDGSEFVLDLYDDNVLVSQISLGLVKGESSFKDIATLVTEITAVTNFSAVASGNDTRPAAFLDITRNLDIDSGGATIPYLVWELAALPTNAPTPFTTAQTKTGESDFENATFANLNSVLYIATGYDPLYKYDGTRIYRAGLPKPATAPTTNLIAGSVTDTNRKYQYTYEYTDAKGNIIESQASDESGLVSPTAQDVEVTVSNILDTTGFDTDSTDLKINLYATESGGSTFYLIKTVVNDGTSATQVIVDDVASPSLGVDFIPPVKTPGLPPIGKYLTSFQGLLIIGGDNNNVDTVHYSDIDSPEYFDPASSSFLVDTSMGDKVTGVAPLGNSLFVFKNNTIHQLTGELADDKFRVDLYGNARIGCAAHATIQEVNGFLTFLSSKGVYALDQNARELAEVSDLIENKFTAFDQPFNFTKATAINWLDEDKYLLFMPSETSDYADSESRIFVFDTFRKAWLEWDSMNAMGGFAIANSNLYFTSREFNASTASTEYYLHLNLNSGDTWDYADHSNAISFSFKSNWESIGEPSIFKKFLRCKIHSLDASLNDFESDAFSLDLETELDYINVYHTKDELDFSGSNLGWGISEWGIFSWGDSRLTARVLKLKSGKAKALRLILQNSSIHENVLISGYELEIAMPYRETIKE